VCTNHPDCVKRVIPAVNDRKPAAAIGFSGCASQLDGQKLRIPLLLRCWRQFLTRFGRQRPPSGFDRLNEPSDTDES